MYSNLRFVISASVVGCAGLIAVLALLPATLEDRLLASAELAAPAARPCKQQIWLNLDRNCLTRRGMPWVAAAPSDTAQAPASPATSGDQAWTETPSSAAAAEEAARPGEITASRQETGPAPIAEEASTTTQTSEAVPPPQQEPTLPQQTATTPPPQEPVQQQDIAAPQPGVLSPKQQQAAAPQLEQVEPQQQAPTPQLQPPTSQQETSAPAAPEESQHTTKRRSVTPVRHVAPVAPPISEKRHAAKANVEAQPRATAGKSVAREARGAKPANEALNAVRRFQDNLRDIPVSSYAADGTPRTIVIRPTSIQDVYYYSAPR